MSKSDHRNPQPSEGKKQYGREFLLQLQSHPLSLHKPNNLPNLDMFKKKIPKKKLPEVNKELPPVVKNPNQTYDPFMPKYAQAGAKSRMHQKGTYYPTRAYFPPILAASQQYLWNYNTSPPPQNSNGYFPSYGISSCQSMLPQMPPQSIAAYPLQQQSRRGAKLLPIIDPKTGKNVLLPFIKCAKHNRSRSNSETDSENSDSNTKKQVTAVLNDSCSDMVSKQPESVRTDTLCSHENEGMKIQETPVGELFEEKITELQSVETLREISEDKNLICNEEISESYYRKDIDLNSIIQYESGANKNVDTISKTEDTEQNVFELPAESSVLNTEVSQKIEKKFASNFEKMGVAVSPVSTFPPVTTATPTPVLEINRSSVTITDSEISNSITLSGEDPDLIPHIGLSSSKPSEMSSVSNCADGEDKENDSDLQPYKKNLKCNHEEEPALNYLEYNEDDMERMNKPFIEEFFHKKDFEKAIKCILELASPNIAHMFINAAIHQVLEQSSHARYSLGQLLCSLLKKNIITIEQYTKGFSSVLEMMYYYPLDIYSVRDCIGEILEPIVEDTENPVKLLKEVLQPYLPSENAGVLVSSILHCAVRRKGILKLGEVWRKSGVQWSEIIGTDKNIAEFIEKQKLEFTVSPVKVTPQTRMSMQDMKKHLLSKLEDNAELEEVFNWIVTNVSDSTRPTFVRALVTAIHESCLTGSGSTLEINYSKLISRIPLISHFVSANKKLQLQALYAVQALMHKLGHPRGFLHQIFDALFDYGIIRKESFKEWAKSYDPNEVEGKRVAVHSVKLFFVWL